MANPLMGLLGGGQPNLGGPFANMSNLMQQFQQFKQSFKGDPKQQVQELLNSGKMTQDQLQQCEQIARQLQNVLH